MKKIGILTFHRASNYGAVLQTYALQKYLISVGYEAEIIDYRCDAIEKHIKSVGFNYNFIHPIKFLRGLKNKRILIDKRKYFRDFIERNVILSKTVYDSHNVENSNAEYDLFFVGSDQVWSPIITGLDETYFLSFVCDKKKKNSYAASVGNSIIEETYKSFFSSRLNSFNKISVREESTRCSLNEIVEKDVCSVVDPVFLLKKEDWILIEEKPRFKLPKKFVVLYLLFEDKNLIQYAKDLSKKHNAKIIYITENLFNIGGVLNKRKVTPCNWIYLFNHAIEIVTNSFHGTAMSMILNKRFVVGLIENRPINNRLKDLTNRIGVELCENCPREISEYDLSTLEIEIQKSKDYIFKCTEGE